MNATTTATPAKRRASLGSIVWYAVLIGLPLITAAFLFWLRQVQVHELAQRQISDYGPAPEFRLTNQNGQPFGSAELKGKIWIADFVFTSCPGPCPMISSRMAETQKPLAKSDVHLVTFTVDPETDTPEVLRDYAHRLGANPAQWDFLTGSKQALYAVVRDGFKLPVAEGAGDEGQLVHSTRAALVDRHGRIRGYYDITAADGVATLLAGTSKLLREQPRGR